ncbi:restriction endonuclease subunit S [Methylobacter sp. BlB1]|uniref:restriction endonuclease subunit S n=1 Tax=Methylobacter sp. BlB1 TaxID=2785914 RepID=UPI001893C9B4|nr:restriction endonuclease subunit S [Methylobacter sp. BlB1]MBF6650430.1 restriction endonuclease subunit S [Methylobacter sp. BlB1]
MIQAEAFEALASSSNGIAKLRQLILELAVRGLLVPQDPNDEPASILLERIAAEKQRLIKDSKIKKQQSLQPITDEEKLFNIPTNWEFIRICELGVISGGMTPSKSRSDFWEGSINWFSPKDIKSDELIESELKISKAALSDTGLQLYPPGCLFIVARSGILKRTLPVAINRVDATANQDLKVISPFVKGMEKYIQLMLKGLTSFILTTLVKTGTTVQSLKYEEFELQAVPLPPISEQQRIIKKIDELMALCDQLDQHQNHGNTVHQQLLQTLFESLTQAVDNEAFQKIWSQIAAHFDTLFTTEASIDQLKQVILQLAVMGKLVPQDPNDEPASVLLEKINVEKQRLIKEGKIKKQKPLLEINDEEKPFDIPFDWKFVRISNLGVISGGMTPSKNRSDFWKGSINWFSPKDIKSVELFDSELKISASALDDTGLQLYPPGCLFIVARSGILKRTLPVSINRVPATANQDLKVILPFKKGMERYIQLMLHGMTNFILANLVKTGTTVQSLKYEEFELQAVPLPSLTEQHRIIAKVDELMAICDLLKSRINKSQQTQEHLATAIVEKTAA